MRVKTPDRAVQELPTDPTSHGWSSDDKSLQPITLAQYPAANIVIELVYSTGAHQPACHMSMLVLKTLPKVQVQIIALQ